MSQDPRDQWKRTSWNLVTKELKLRGQSTGKITEFETEELYKTIQENNQLLSDRDGTLKEHTSELLSTTDNLDKDPDDQLDLWKRVKDLQKLRKDLMLRGESETMIIQVEAEMLSKAIQVYNKLLFDHDGTLREHISQLRSTADNLDKVSKGTKIAGITGGATSVAGGVAAAAGVILSPFTMGASLALTAVGVGVAAAGGVTGASAAIAHKVNMTQDRKKIEKILQDHEELMEDIRTGLKYINEGLGQLKKHDQSILKEAKKELGKLSWVVALVTIGGASAKAIEANSKASGLIEGFALGMDFYFTQGKDGQQKVKKGLESQLAKKICTLVVALSKGLDELQEIKSLFKRSSIKK